MKYAEVKEAVRKHMIGHERGESTTSWVQFDLAREFDINIQPHNWTGYRRSEGETFERQVARALNQLADEGVLVKTIRHTHGRRKEAFWTRTDVAEARQQDRAAKAQAYANRQELRDQLAIRFSEAGYQVEVAGETKYGPAAGSVIFRPEDASRLLSRLLGVSDFDQHYEEVKNAFPDAAS